ncbi:MAG TPA: hypothetical protein VM536_20960 [Chloroflexia bacterium]|nr:hypothetical protein [Chloroflexia bacterium]
MADDRATPSDYDQMLLLEDLESLAEEMDEVGVADIEEVRHWLATPASDIQAGVPPVADQVALKSILDLMEELEVQSRDELAARIRTMHEEMSWS